MSRQEPPTGLLNRQQWLEAHHFVEDPFGEKSLRGETDPVLADHKDAFVDILGFTRSELPNEPGAPFIFARSGAGKSSLRKWIYREYHDRLLRNQPGVPRILPVEYVKHGDLPDKCSATEHARNIAELVHKELKARAFDFTLQIDMNLPASALLENVFEQCREHGGLVRICVLVDNIDLHREQDWHKAFGRILTLAGQHDLLDIPGYIFKFMLPDELSGEQRKRLPLDKFNYQTIHWEPNHLESALAERLFAVMSRPLVELLPSSDPSPGEIIAVAMAEICNEQLRSVAGKDLIAFGEQRQQPRSMLRLCYELLDEHFASSNGVRHVHELIERPTFDRALEKLTRQESTGIQASASEQWEAAFLATRKNRFTSEDIERIWNLLRSNQIEVAAREIEKTDRPLGIVIQRQFKQLEQDQRLGIISRTEANVEKNALTYKIIERLEELTDS